ncbi:MAG TPA: hypothetical protein VH370_10055 [Humisphaera sp.]|jgi:hypothetical protein|nr:hypothetical protein [Humisphaera sp.]
MIPANDPPHAPDAAEPAAGSVVNGIVVIDISCRKCAYDLRGLPVESNCPECGTSVGASFKSDLLRFSDPGWLDVLRKGANSTIVGVCVVVLGSVILIGASIAGSSAVPRLASGFILLVGYFLVIRGAWLLASPDPRGVGEDQYQFYRRIFRGSLLIGAAYLLVPTLLGTRILPQAVGNVLGVVIGLPANLAIFTACVLQVLYLRKLAMRIPDEALANGATYLIPAFAGTAGVFGVVSGLFPLVFESFRAARLFSSLLDGVNSGVGWLILFIFYIRLLQRLGARFKEQADYARQTQAASPLNSPPASGSSPFRSAEF